MISNLQETLSNVSGNGWFRFVIEFGTFNLCKVVLQCIQELFVVDVMFGLGPPSLHRTVGVYYIHTSISVLFIITNNDGLNKLIPYG